jgi:hypothetical protein
MAILGFHFSGVYKKSLYEGSKTATIFAGEQFFKIGEEVQVYLSEKDNLFDGFDEKRIGSAIVECVLIKKVKELTDSEAITCASTSLDELKSALKKWYNYDDDSIVSYVRFKLKLL